METNNKPPRWADRFLTWFCSEEIVETVQGDLYELYGKRLSERGKTVARLCYIRDVFDLCRPFAFKRMNRITTTTDMHKHTLLLVYRSFLRYKSSFFINLIGLSTGLACALLIYFWVSDELNVDKFNAKDARLYQVLVNSHDEVNGIQTGPVTPGILAEALAREIPEVEYAASVVPASWFSEQGIISLGEKKIKSKAHYASRDYFNMFSIDFINGNPRQALTDKYGMAISEEMAVKLFKSTANSIGKTVEWIDGTVPGSYHITGVFRNPNHTTSPAEILLNYDVFLDSRPWLKEWGNSDPLTFVLLREGADGKAFSTKIEGFIKSKYNESRNTLVAQRFSERYLHGRYENGVPAGGRIEYVRLFSIIAVFILVIACINFMNLSTAKASRRVKEIGVKKAIGASRYVLFIQYLEESMLMAFLSLIVALALVYILLPQFNQMTGKYLHLSADPRMVLALLGVVLFTGLVAGSYPAMYLSAFRPAEVLKGKLRSSLGERWIRKGLVVFQFAISVLLIVCVVVVYRQIAYVQSKNLGYNRDNVLHFDGGIRMENSEGFFDEGGKHEKEMETFLQQVRNLPGVTNVANYEHDLTGRHGGLQGVDWKGGKEDERMHFNNLQVGFDFIETMGIRLAEGRSFSSERSKERSKILFNEEAIRVMGLKDPVGKVIRVWGQEKEIIGVAKDFHIESLFEEVRPCIIQLEPRSLKIMVKIKGGAEQETIAQLEKIYQGRNPGLAFDYGFVDDDYQALYVSEQRVSLISRYFAGLTILISSLGLFGLAAFTVEKRTKEIGIRKILGSSNARIAFLLSGDFTKLVLLAILIALPLSFFIARNWLNGFAYSIGLEWWFFLGAALIAMVIPFVAVGIQTIKASRVSPVESLKEE